MGDTKWNVVCSKNILKRMRNKNPGSFFIIPYYDHKSAIWWVVPFFTCLMPMNYSTISCQLLWKVFSNPSFSTDWVRGLHSSLCLLIHSTIIRWTLYWLDSYYSLRQGLWVLPNSSHTCYYFNTILSFYFKKGYQREQTLTLIKCTIYCTISL